MVPTKGKNTRTPKKPMLRNGTLSFLPPSVGQARFMRGGNGFHLLMGIAIKLHCKGMDRRKDEELWPLLQSVVFKFLQLSQKIVFVLLFLVLYSFFPSFLPPLPPSEEIR